MARIIIAEDDPISVYLVRSALEDRGHIVGVLPDGSRVLDVATTKRPDLLILDASMPLKGGLDALREVRARLGWSMPKLKVRSARIESRRTVAAFLAPRGGA